VRDSIWYRGFTRRILEAIRRKGIDGCNWFVCFLCCPFDQAQCPECCLPYCDPGDQVQAEEDLSSSAAGTSGSPETVP